MGCAFIVVCAAIEQKTPAGGREGGGGRRDKMVTHLVVIDRYRLVNVVPNQFTFLVSSLFLFQCLVFNLFLFLFEVDLFFQQMIGVLFGLLQYITLSLTTKSRTTTRRRRVGNEPGGTNDKCECTEYIIPFSVGQSLSVQR